MKNQVAWELAVVLAVVVLGGIGVGIHHTYEFHLMHLDYNRKVHYGKLRYKTYPFVTHYVELGPVSVLWSRR